MRMGSLYGHVKELSAQHVGGADTPADHGGPGPVDSGIRPLSPAQSEFHNPVTLCGVAYPCGLCCNQALVVDNVQDCRLHQLRLHDGSNDLYQRFPGKYNSPLRNGIDIAGEMEIRKIRKEILLKNPESGKIVNILRGKVQLPDIADQLL